MIEYAIERPAERYKLRVTSRSSEQAIYPVKMAIKPGCVSSDRFEEALRYTPPKFQTLQRYCDDCLPEYRQSMGERCDIAEIIFERSLKAVDFLRMGVISQEDFNDIALRRVEAFQKGAK